MNTQPDTLTRPFENVITDIRILASQRAHIDTKIGLLRQEMSNAVLNAPVEQLIDLIKPAGGKLNGNDELDAVTLTSAMFELQGEMRTKMQLETEREIVKRNKDGSLAGAMLAMEQEHNKRMERLFPAIDPAKTAGKSLEATVIEEAKIGTRICNFCGQERRDTPGPCLMCDDRATMTAEMAAIKEPIIGIPMPPVKCDYCGHAHPCLCDTSKLAMAKSPAKQVEKSDHCSLLPTIILFGGNREHELKMMKEEMPDANWRLISSRDGRMFSEMSYDWVVINVMIVPPGAMDYAKKRIPTGRSVCWNGTKRDMERCCGWLREKIKANTKPVRE